MRLYVETRVRADLDELWARTQDPAEHQRWDLRFTEIRHLPRAGDGSRHFRYATRVLPFLTIAGTGVSAGEKERPDGTRTSALRFSCPHPLSLLADGSGYWRYVPDGSGEEAGDGTGVRFLTGYDYRPRWGAVGALADRLVLRPLMGWATAWSFDRLRIWLEHGVTPERARRNWLTELTLRAAVITAAGTALTLKPVALLGSAGAFLPPLLLMAAAAAAFLAPPLARTPAARRCLRTPPDPVRPPRLLRTLEAPR
ncbi:hypothetical protein ACIF80_00110 [Streptomyces sp. NPDC085927]|uniref:hypothetical protein n=1 Tax=Streptomyces sp. NPDC085927 TaxID=3365738 RepID=UPI0037D19D9A